MSSDTFVVLAGATLVIGVLSVLGMSRGTTSSAQAHDVKPLPKPAVEVPAGKPGEIRSVVLAGGCFWCTEGAFAQFKGVQDVTSGYAGDTKDKADYRTVCTGTTKHAEAIKITYDAGMISYSQLLQVFFV